MSNVCTICEKVFKQKCHLTRHLKTVHGSKKEEIACKQCKEKFARPDNLLRHVQRQHGNNETVNSFVSDENEEDMDDISQPYDISNDPVLNVKSLPPMMKNICLHCGEVFNQEASLINHLETVHEENSVEFACFHCRKVFKRKSPLINHLKTVHNKTSVDFICKRRPKVNDEGEFVVDMDY